MSKIAVSLLRRVGDMIYRHVHCDQVDVEMVEFAEADVDVRRFLTQWDESQPQHETAARDMHGDFSTLAESIANDCIEQGDGGEKWFNLFVFIERLSDRIDGLLNDGGCWRTELNSFKLDAESIARYLWCCMAIKSEGNAYPKTFRGMPILD